MPNYGYQKGVRAERRLKKRLEAQDFFVIRSAGSKGKVDIAAFKRCDCCISCRSDYWTCESPIVKFYQVKTGKAKPDKEEKKAILSVEKKTGISIELISM